MLKERTNWNQIRQLIKNSDGNSFETERSIQQDLSFDEAKVEFKSRNVLLTSEKFVSLGIQDAEKKIFTNLALLISDQCSYSIKVAVFEDKNNTIFKDRREFGGSVFKQLRNTYDYLMLNNRIASTVKGLDRIDHVDYPSEAIREALLNAIIHRDYGYSGSIIVNINREQMEFISIGGLPLGLTTADIKNGISQPRNTQLAQIFFRLRHIEAYGTGIRRIMDLYKDSSVKPSISVTENTFRIILPNKNFIHSEINRNDRVAEKSLEMILAPTKQKNVRKIAKQMQEVLSYLRHHDYITEQELMKLLNVKRTRAYLITKQMTDIRLIQKIGRGHTKKFVRIGEF